MLVPLAYIHRIQCEYRPSFQVVCVVWAALEISRMDLGEWSARWLCGWTAFKGAAIVLYTLNSLCTLPCCSEIKSTDFFINLTESFFLLLLNCQFIHVFGCYLRPLVQYDCPVNADWLTYICYLFLFICICACVCVVFIWVYQQIYT